MGDAELHDGAAARRPPDARPLLGADRRRELLGLHLRLPPRPRADRRGAAGDEGRPRRAQREHPGHLPAGGQQGQRLPDGPRGAEARRDFSGIKGIAIQDSSLQESMGPIVDRTKERLVSADSGIIKARQKLRKAALALRDEGVTPARRRPGAPPGAVGGGRAAAGRVVPGRGPATTSGSKPGVPAGVGLSMSRRHRVSEQLRQGGHRRRGALPDRRAGRSRRNARVVALDDARGRGRPVGRRRRSGPAPASSCASAVRPAAATPATSCCAASTALRPSWPSELDGADVVVMVATAGRRRRLRLRHRRGLRGARRS